MRPSVVLASKSGAVSPKCSAISWFLSRRLSVAKRDVGSRQSERLVILIGFTGITAQDSGTARVLQPSGVQPESCSQVALAAAWDGSAGGRAERPESHA